MPRELSNIELHLIQILKEYWRNQKFFLTDKVQAVVQSVAGYQGWLEDLEDRYFKDDSYYSALALSIAKEVCLSSQVAWEILLIRHGYNGRWDQSFYLRAVISDLQQLSAREELNPVDPQYIDLQQLPEKLREATEIVATETNATRLAARMEQLAIPISRARDTTTREHQKARCLPL